MKYKDILQEYDYREQESYPCSYFGSCGGCTFQDLEYEQQLALKSKYLHELFRDLYEEPIVINPADPWKYRNKMDFIYAFRKLGLRKRGDFKGVVDLESCLLIQERSLTIFKKIRSLLKEYEINSFSFLSHKGYLRYVVFRQMGNSGELMINFIINGTDTTPLIPLIEDLKDEVDSIIISENSAKADLSYGTILEYFGRESIQEKLADISYKILPNSFFQSNSAVTEQMYTLIKQNINPGETVLDLYSGVGSISLFIADRAGKVTGVELNNSAVLSAQENTELNNTSNVDFIEADVLQYLRNEPDQADVWVIDPPRAGIHPKVLKKIVEIKPQKLIYISCNPDQLFRDLQELQNVYNIVLFEGFDMFPQTYHLESVMILTKK